MVRNGSEGKSESLNFMQCKHSITDYAWKNSSEWRRKNKISGEIPKENVFLLNLLLRIDKHLRYSAQEMILIRSWKIPQT